VRSSESSCLCTRGLRLAPCYHPPTCTDPKHLLCVTSLPTNDNGLACSYRPAVIVTNKRGTNCSFSLEGFPRGSNGRWGVVRGVSVIPRLVDAWLDHGTLSAPHVLARVAGQGQDRFAGPVLLARARRFLRSSFGGLVGA
jgi:hypothetical protein